MALLLGAGCSSVSPNVASDPSNPDAGPPGQEVADPDRPPPQLPEYALFLGDYGDCELTIKAWRDGTIQQVTISKPSTGKVYDEHIRSWVANKWKMPPASNSEPDLRSFIAPITFRTKSQWPAGGKFPPPPYPDLALKAHQEAIITVAMVVAEDGQIESAEVIGGSKITAFDKHTVDWVKRKWRFPPGNQRQVYWSVAYLLHR